MNYLCSTSLSNAVPSLVNASRASTSTSLISSWASRRIAPSMLDGRFLAPALNVVTTLGGPLQRRELNKVNSTSILQQWYNRLSIRRKWRRAIKKGTLYWDDTCGQVKIPPLEIQGYETKPYKGRLENCKVQRIVLRGS